MTLDVLTLMAVGSFITAISGLVLAGAWTQIRKPALLWWAGASLIYSVGIALLAGATVPLLAIGIAMLSLAPAFVWAGARSFNGRRQLWALLVVGAILGVIAGAIPFSGSPATLPSLANFAAWVVYLAAAGFELWRGQNERLAARIPLIGFLGLHAIVFIGGIVDTLRGSMPMATNLPLFANWFSLIHLETIVYAVATSVFMVLLCKERSELQVVRASRRDSLTGIANRGALLEGGERLLKRCQQDGMSFSLIMFDLDHFKRVNDTYGHVAGDAVLRDFAETCLAIVRPSDLLGRYGGEEFVVALPRATIEAAYVIADRIRNAFAAAPIVVSDVGVRCTVSAGVAAAGSAATTLEEIIKLADAALYQAKALGRNRVERAAMPAEDPAAANIIRVA